MKSHSLSDVCFMLCDMLDDVCRVASHVRDKCTFRDALQFMIETC